MPESSMSHVIFERFEGRAAARSEGSEGSLGGWLATLCAVLLLFASFHALGAQEQPLPGFSEVIDVRVVNLEVVVTDKQGNRVSGLQVKDFRLRVDGDEVAIDYFSEVNDGTARPRSTVIDTPAVPSLEPGTRLRTNYLIFIDDFFSIARDRNRVLDRLQEDLSDLGANDRVSVVAFDGKKLELLTGWASDRAELNNALRRARERRAYGLHRLAELRTNDQQRRERQGLATTLDEFIVAAGGEVPEGAFFANRLDGVELEYANRLHEQVSRSVLAATSALRSFAGPSGRKVMLILSGGWPFSPSEYTVNSFSASVEETISGALDNDLGGRGRLFRPLSDTANLLGYTLYPVDVPGQNRARGLDASEDFTPFERVGLTPGAGGSASPREEGIHDGLRYLARETGGVPLLNALRNRSLAEAVADTRSFYWLGFTPERLENDAAHDIEVEVIGRPDLKVRAREGYVDLSRGTEITMMVESALLFGDPPSNKPLRLHFGRPRRSGLGKMRVPLEVGLSMDEITLLPNQGRFVSELEIRITVMDEQGNRSQTNIEKIRIDGDQPARPGQFYYYETVLILRKKEHRIVVAVYDPLSGAILSSSSDISDL